VGSRSIGVRWQLLQGGTLFSNLRLKYAQILLSDSDSIDRAAIAACYPAVRRERLTRRELRSTVLRLGESLSRLGVCQDDRVVAVARNSVEAVVAALATAAIGGVVLSCAPDMVHLPFKCR